MRYAKNRRRISMAIVLAMLASFLVMPVSASAAAGAFTGGPDQCPTYVANDHTPFAVHFTASGLTPNSSYYLKVRLTVGTSPSGTTNRGYTWNATSKRWVQEREDWTLFPLVTTDANGSISSSSGWVFAKFADDAHSGLYHLMISLSATGDAATFNATNLPAVNVIDPRVNGSWVHNGVATGIAANKNARITDEASSTVFALQKTEGQSVDDDANGTVDDEDFGPVGDAGDFRMALPATATPISVSLNQTVWAPGTGFVIGAPDTDLAIGASDIVAPSAPGALNATSSDGSNTLSWTPASDNTAVAGYCVYRWTAAPVGAAYSPVHARIATLAANATSFTDTGLTNGTAYYYEVRAFDAATNVGPRIASTAVTPQVDAPTASVSPAAPDGGNGWYRTPPTVTLASQAGRTIQYSFETTPSEWTTYTVPVTIPTTASATLSFRDTDGVTASAVQRLDFRVDGGAPGVSVTAPTFSVQQTKDRTFKVAWAGIDAVSGIASYDVSYKNGASGSWKVLRSATRSTSTVFSGSSGADYYFRVKSRDAAGNTSAWVSSAGTAVPQDQTSSLVRFSHGWSTVKHSSAFLGSVKYSKTRNASVSYTLTHGTLYLVATTGPTRGRMAVYYRGHKVTTLDFYSKTTKYRQTFKLATFASGHAASAVKLVNLATSHRPGVEIDGFAARW